MIKRLLLTALAIATLATGTTMSDVGQAQPSPPAAQTASATAILNPPAATTVVDEQMAARFAAVLSDISQRATALGLSARTVATAFDGLTADPEVLDLSRRQPEFNTAIWTYLDRLVSEKRIVDGRQKLETERQTLLDIEAAFGVDRHVVLAIWGIESNYGASMGERRIVRSLATLAAADERRATFWRGELVAALRILERAETTPDRLVGSWAGAMGHTQFIPSTYAQHAMDFDGDGRRDIWTSVADALASTARYLKASGWQGDRPCAFEVALPVSFDHALAEPRTEKPFAAWAAIGIKPAGDGTNSAWTSARRLPGPALLRVLLPAGAKGPAFLVTQNFGAVLKYNQSVAYALAVCHLADRLAGGDPVLAAWPVDDLPLSRADREEMQRLLSGLGHDVGTIDGMIGGKSQAAIRAYQRASGLPADGYASQRLLERLRRDARL